jgi:hypothetical protein
MGVGGAILCFRIGSDITAIDSTSTIHTASVTPPASAPPASAAANEEENKMASARYATMHTPTVPDFPRPGDWVVALCVT